MNTGRPPEEDQKKPLPESIVQLNRLIDTFAAVKVDSLDKKVNDADIDAARNRLIKQCEALYVNCNIKAKSDENIKNELSVSNRRFAYACYRAITQSREEGHEGTAVSIEKVLKKLQINLDARVFENTAIILDSINNILDKIRVMPEVQKDIKKDPKKPKMKKSQLLLDTERFLNNSEPEKTVNDGKSLMRFVRNAEEYFKSYAAQAEQGILKNALPDFFVKQYWADTIQVADDIRKMLIPKFEKVKDEFRADYELVYSDIDKKM